MNIKVDDIIKVENAKTLILTMFEDSGKNYAFGNVITDDEEDVTDEYVLIEIGANNEIIAIKDEATLNRVAPKIQAGLEKAIADMDN